MFLSLAYGFSFLVPHQDQVESEFYGVFSHLNTNIFPFQLMP